MTRYPLKVETTIKASSELENMWQTSLNTLKDTIPTHESFRRPSDDGLGLYDIRTSYHRCFKTT